MDLGDRRLVAAERGGLAPLPCPRVEVIGDDLRCRRQRDPAMAPAPEVERLEVGLERANAVRRRRRLVGGNQRRVDNDARAGCDVPKLTSFS